MEQALEVLYSVDHDPEAAAEVLKKRHGIFVVMPATNNVESLTNHRTPNTRDDGGNASCGSSTTEKLPGGEPDTHHVTKAGAEQTKKAETAFMTHGRDLDAVKRDLQWEKKKVVEYYYRVWKFEVFSELPGDFVE